MPGVFIRPRARRDLNTILAYYIETAGANVARRFRLAATETFHDLNAFPSMGAPARVRNPRYRGTRMWRIKGFGHYLVFYVPAEQGVMIERVVHAAQDYHRVLR